MGDDVITTRVDDLISFLEGKDRVSLLDAAKELGVQIDTLQSWVDFLVEEGILGIEYKFTKPFIYLNKTTKKKAHIVEEETANWPAFKKAFLTKAMEKKIPEVKATALWKNHLLTALEKKKQFFYDEARKRELASIDTLWSEYKTGAMSYT